MHPLDFRGSIDCIKNKFRKEVKDDLDSLNIMLFLVLTLPLNTITTLILKIPIVYVHMCMQYRIENVNYI